MQAITSNDPASPGKDFPEPTLADLSGPIAIDADEARRLFRSTIVAVSNEEMRHYLCGVNVRSVDGRLATDATNRFIAISMSSSIEAQIEPVILPTLAVQSALSAMGDERLSISLSEKISKIDSGPFSLITRNVDGTFPEIERIKASEPTLSIAVDRNDFVSAVQRVHGLTEESKDAVNKIRGRLISLEAKRDVLVIRSAGSSATSGVDEIDADIDGNPIDLGFQAEYLLKLASVCPDGKLTIGASEPHLPVSFGYETMNGWSVAMPARV